MIFKDKKINIFINDNFKLDIEDLQMVSVITNWIGTKTIIYENGKRNLVTFLYENGQIENFYEVRFNKSFDDIDEHEYSFVIYKDDKVLTICSVIRSIVIINNHLSYIDNCGQYIKSLNANNNLMSEEERTKILMLGDF